MDIKNSVALVTGTNRGVGRAIVEALVAAGARKVYAAARNTDGIKDLVAAGGKRTRPMIAFLAAQVLGASPARVGWKNVVDLGVCVELLHSASLLHDDLIDDSDTRRGHVTAFRRFGNVVSVMSGDFMLSRLLMLLAQMPGSAALTHAFGQTASVICEGEVLQFQLAAYQEYELRHYLQVIHGKTAALTELAASAPAVLLGASAPVQEALATFGRMPLSITPRRLRSSTWPVFSVEMRDSGSDGLERRPGTSLM